MACILNTDRTLWSLKDALSLYDFLKGYNKIALVSGQQTDVLGIAKTKQIQDLISKTFGFNSSQCLTIKAILGLLSSPDNIQNPNRMRQLNLMPLLKPIPRGFSSSQDTPPEIFLPWSPAYNERVFWPGPEGPDKALASILRTSFDISLLVRECNCNSAVFNPLDLSTRSATAPDSLRITLIAEKCFDDAAVLQLGTGISTPFLLACFANARCRRAVARVDSDLVRKIAHAQMWSALLLAFLRHQCRLFLGSEETAIQQMQEFPSLVSCIRLPEHRVELLSTRSSALLPAVVASSSAMFCSSLSYDSSSKPEVEPLPSLFPLRSLYCCVHIGKRQKWQEYCSAQDAYYAHKASDRAAHVLHVKYRRCDGKCIETNNFGVLVRAAFVNECVDSYALIAKQRELHCSIRLLLRNGPDGPALHRPEYAMYYLTIVVRVESEQAAYTCLGCLGERNWQMCFLAPEQDMTHEHNDTNTTNFLAVLQKKCMEYESIEEAAESVHAIAKYVSASVLHCSPPTGQIPLYSSGASVLSRLLPYKLGFFTSMSNPKTSLDSIKLDREHFRTAAMRAAIHCGTGEGTRVVFACPHIPLAENIYAAPTCMFGTCNKRGPDSHFCDAPLVEHTKQNFPVAILCRQELPMLFYNLWIRCAENSAGPISRWIVGTARRVADELADNTKANASVMSSSSSVMSSSSSSSTWNVPNYITNSSSASTLDIPPIELNAALLLHCLPLELGTGYSNWVRVGMLLHTLDPDSEWLRLCFRWWSKRCQPENYKDSDHVGVHAKWKYLVSKKGGTVTTPDAAMRCLRAMTDKTAAQNTKLDEVVAQIWSESEQWFDK